MKIRIHLYKVEIREVTRKGRLKKGEPRVAKEIHEVEDLGLAKEVYDIDEKQDLKLVVSQIAQDNQANEKMVTMIHPVGEVFTLKVKILAND